MSASQQPPEKTGEQENHDINSLRRIIAAYAKFVVRTMVAPKKMQKPINFWAWSKHSFILPQNPSHPLASFHDYKFSGCNSYQYAAERDVKRYERSFKMLPPTHKDLLSHLGLKYKRLRWCISMNAAFIQNMLVAFKPPFGMSQYLDDLGHDYPANVLDRHEHHGCPKEDAKSHESSTEMDDKKVKVTPRHYTTSLIKVNILPMDVDEVRRILRNIVRDWTEEGQRERDECYKPILEELNRLFPNRNKQRPPSCLVPGAGLGRLVLEISSLGFMSQGIEFSYYMLICSNFILNHTRQANEWTIYPWIHNNCNSLSDDDQLRPVNVPDIHPSSAVREGFSMCRGDFVEVYSEESQESAWDAVVTCFFLDTAHNIVEYIEIISNILKDGGVWINFCPLLYHFAESYGPDDDMSIELSLEDVKRVAYHYGFVTEMENIIETTFSANMRAMMQNRYRAAFWTMRKNAACSKAQKHQCGIRPSSRPDHYTDRRRNPQQY